jgi:hypothetical protein
MKYLKYWISGMKIATGQFFMFLNVFYIASELFTQQTTRSKQKRKENKLYSKACVEKSYPFHLTLHHFQKDAGNHLPNYTASHPARPQF